MQTATFAEALQRLLDSVPEAETVLMCAEAVPWRCHRSLVGDALLARGIAVEDIFYDKQGASHRKPHTLTPFAKVSGTEITYPAAEVSEAPLFRNAPGSEGT